jgi:hypothetical protein
VPKSERCDSENGSEPLVWVTEGEHMRSSTRSWWGLIVAGAVVLAGCGDDSTNGGEATSSPTQAPEPSTSTAAPSTEDEETTTSEPTLSPGEQDKADIEETLHRFTKALNRAYTGEASIEGIYPYSRDNARDQWITEVMAAEAQGMTLTGEAQLEVLEVSVNGDTAEALACFDASDVEVVDKEGNSITEGRLDRTLTDYVLERDDSAELGWYVVEDSNRNEPCEE